MNQPFPMSRAISGRWVGASPLHLLQLRLDVGPDSLGVVSGDLYERIGPPETAASAVDDPDDPASGWRYELSFFSRVVVETWGEARQRELAAPLGFFSRAELHGQLFLRFRLPARGRPET